MFENAEEAPFKDHFLFCKNCLIWDYYFIGGLGENESIGSKNSYRVEYCPKCQGVDYISWKKMNAAQKKIAIEINEKIERMFY